MINETSTVTFFLRQPEGGRRHNLGCRRLETDFRGDCAFLEYAADGPELFMHLLLAALQTDEVCPEPGEDLRAEEVLRQFLELGWELRMERENGEELLGRVVPGAPLVLQGSRAIQIFVGPLRGR